ncbi:MAG: hypothetical protein RIC55_05190 [Pirellulaceae bacterium]
MPEFRLPHTLCRFGIARRDVTPPVGIYHRMWGAAAHDRSEGVHRPLTATAVVLSPRDDATCGDALVLIALDHCLLFAKEMNALLARVAETSEIDPGRIVVAFSHTHGAGLMDPRRAHLPGGDLIQPYLEHLQQTTAAAVVAAQADMTEATITYALGKCDLAADRDYWDESSGQFVCGFNPSAPADDAVLVGRVTGAGGELRATLVNYACHPTTLAWDNRLISPDFPGAMRETIELASGAPCVFLQGASGELGPREGFVGDVAVADRNGRQLGYAALSALESMPPPRTELHYDGPVISGATIGNWVRTPLDDDALRAARHWQREHFTVALPYRDGMPSIEQTHEQRAHWNRTEAEARAAGDEAAAADARAMVERMNRWLTRLEALPPGDQFPMPVTLLRAGQAWWLAVEGEPYNLLQRALRERFPQTPIVVMVLAGGSRSWYLPTADTYGKGIYQESMANLAPGCLERLIEAIGERMAQMEAAAST